MSVGLLQEVSQFTSGGFIPSRLHLEMDGVKVRFPLSPALDRHQTGGFQFGDQLGDTRPGHAHVLRQPVLSRKTGIVVPGVAQKHGVGDLGANGDIRVFQDEIRDLGKTVLQHGIDRVQLQILLLEDFPDGFHVWYDYLTSKGQSPNVDNPASLPLIFKTFMDQNQHNQSEMFRRLPKSSATCGTVPKPSASDSE